MSRPLTDLERDLLEVLANDRADVAARAGLAELWARHGDHAALLRPLAAAPGGDEIAALEARPTRSTRPFAGPPNPSAWLC